MWRLSKKKYNCQCTKAKLTNLSLLKVEFTVVYLKFYIGNSVSFLPRQQIQIYLICSLLAAFTSTLNALVRIENLNLRWRLPEPRTQN